MDARPDGEWYLHLLGPTSPTWTGATRRCVAEFESILRFWLDRGVDGFRMDVAHALFKEPRGCPTPAPASTRTRRATT